MTIRDLKNEMRCAVGFCHHLGKSLPETIDMMKLFVELLEMI